MKIYIIKHRDMNMYYRKTANGLWQAVLSAEYATTYSVPNDVPEAVASCKAFTGDDVIGQVWTRKARETWEVMK